MKYHLLNHSEWNVIMFLVCIDLEYGVSVFYSILKHNIHAIVDKICNVCVNVYRDLGFRPTLVVLLITHICIALLCLLYQSCIYYSIKKKIPSFNIYSNLYQNYVCGTRL